jgi:predicted transcriptional regulator
MREAPHPNKLRMLLAVAGLNQREAAHETGIPEGTLRHYVAGEQVIPRRDRVKLAQVIGCDIEDLAPQYDAQWDRVPKKLESKQRMTDEKNRSLQS